MSNFRLVCLVLSVVECVKEEKAHPICKINEIFSNCRKNR